MPCLAPLLGVQEGQLQTADLSTICRHRGFCMSAAETAHHPSVSLHELLDALLRQGASMAMACYLPAIYTVFLPLEVSWYCCTLI